MLIALGVALVVIFKSKAVSEDDSSAITLLMRKVEMQVVAESSRSQRYSQLQREEDDECGSGECDCNESGGDVECGGDDDECGSEDDLDNVCMSEEELSFLAQLEGASV